MKTTMSFQEEQFTALLGSVGIFSSKARVAISKATRSGFISIDEIFEILPGGSRRSSCNAEEKALMLLNVLSALRIVIILPAPQTKESESLASRESTEESITEPADADLSTEDTEPNKGDLDGVNSMINQTELYELPWADRHDLLYLYLQEIGKFSLLSVQEEVELMRKIEGGERAAWEQFVCANLRLVVWVVRRYARVIEHLTILDLIQEGTLGLFEAIQRFDYRRGYKFSTYAIWWIRQAVHRAIANQERIVRIPVYLSELIWRFKKAEREYVRATGIEPAFKEVAQALRLTPGETTRLEEALRLQEIVSLDDTETGDGSKERQTPLWAQITDEKTPTPEEALVEKSSRHDIQQALHALDKREREVLAMRIGENGDKSFTLEEIGQKFGFTRERARQIAANALQKILRVLDSKPSTPKPIGASAFHPTNTTPVSEDSVFLKRANVCAEEKASEKVLLTVSKTYGISIDDILGSSRKTMYVWPRHVAMYLINIDFNLSFPTIGKIFKRDHTSVLHACDRIKTIVMQDKEVSRAIATIRASYLWR